MGEPNESAENQCLIFQGDFVKRIDLQKRLLKAYAYDRSPKSSQQAHFHSLTSGLVQTVLEIANNGSSAFHVETRFPFIDKRLVEFCLGLPGSQKVNQGYTRITARRALNGIIPEEIRWRSHRQHWDGIFGMGSRLRKILCGQHLTQWMCFWRIAFNKDVLRDIYNRCSNDMMTERDMLILFSFVVMTTWWSQVKSSEGTSRIMEWVT